MQSLESQESSNKELVYGPGRVYDVIRRTQQQSAVLLLPVVNSGDVISAGYRIDFSDTLNYLEFSR